MSNGEAPNWGLGQGLTRWQARALAAVAGGVAALALPPFGAWYAVFAAFALIISLIATAPDARSAAWRGWFAGAGWFALSMHWIVQPFFVDPAVTGWMAPFALVLMAGGLALFWGLAGWLSACLVPTGPGRALAFAGLLTLSEALQGLCLHRPSMGRAGPRPDRVRSTRPVRAGRSPCPDACASGSVGAVDHRLSDARPRACRCATCRWPRAGFDPMGPPRTAAIAGCSVAENRANQRTAAP